MSRLSLTLGLTAMETCWLYPLIVLLFIWGPETFGHWLSPVSVFALVLVGALSTHAWGRRVIGRTRRLALSAVALSAVALAIGPAPVPALVVGLLLWWRGVRIGSQSPSYQDIETEFRWG